MEILDLEISVLSPLHIGCDEQVDPTVAMVSENLLWDEIDLFSAISSKEAREEFRKITQNFSLPEFANFKSKYSDEFKPWSARVDAISTGMADRFSKLLHKESATIQVKRTSFDSLTYQPIIPGTSLKGALRGLLLGAIKGREFSNSEWRFSEDPLSLLSVSDCFVDDSRSARTAFVGTERLYKGSLRVVRQLDENQMGFREVVLPSESVFHGRILLKPAPGGRQLAQNPLSASDVFNLSKRQMENFFAQLVNGERKFWRPEDIDVLWPNRGYSEVYQALFNAVMADPNSILVRLGGASGAEHTSLDWMRSAWRGDDGKPPHTWTVAKFAADKRLPMGWVILTDKRKPENENAKMWKGLLSRFAEEIARNVTFPEKQRLTDYVSKRSAAISLKAEALEREKIEREEQAATLRLQEEQKALKAIEMAAWSEFVKLANSTAEKIEKSAQPIAVNNQLWAELNKVIKAFGDQTDADKQIFLDWYQSRILPKLGVPKEKMKEVRRGLGLV